VPPSYKRFTYGLAIRNLFTTAADIPVQNLARDCQPVSAGVCASLPGSSSSNNPPTVGKPLGVSSSIEPYIVFPNQQPVNVIFYVQAQI
jgi:hypothetical protein